MDKELILSGLNFGRVDAETDDRFDSCFIGTEMLRAVLQPKHSLVLGSKGSGKSAAFRLLCEDQHKVRALLPRGYKEIFCIPAYGLQNEEYVPGMELRELTSHSVDDFRYFWLLYIGLKTVATLEQNGKIKALVAESKNDELKAAYKSIVNVMHDLGLAHESRIVTKLKQRVGQIFRSSSNNGNHPAEMDRLLSGDFRQKTGMSTLALLDNIDTILRETNCLAWVMLDKLDLLFIDDFEKLKAAITGLIQLLVENGNRFKNIHFKILLRNDIYRQLRIVNKSHLVSYTSEMKWREMLLIKLLVSRAVADESVREHCEELIGEKIDITNVIGGDDEYVLKLFYLIFEPSMSPTNGSDPVVPFTHVWILKHLTDGMGNVYPREIIHLGNLAVEKQRELNRLARKHVSTRLISGAALKEAFAAVSVYRCDTYLYSEFPHLSKHFDIFRGSDCATFQREDLNKLFERLTPNGDEAIRAVHDAGLLTPTGRTVDSSLEFKVPLLYRVGLGMVQRKAKTRIKQKLEEAQVEELMMD